jgi:hypothetical protein
MPPRHVGQLLEECPEALLGRGLVPSPLDQDLEDSAVLIHRPPQIVLLPTNGEKDLVQRPCVTWLRTSAAELMGILWAELPAPLADRLRRHDDPTGEQEFCHVAVAEAEPVVEPDALADDLDRKAVMRIERLVGCVLIRRVRHMGLARDNRSTS